jgi:hypothetical protein
MNPILAKDTLLFAALLASTIGWAALIAAQPIEAGHHRAPAIATAEHHAESALCAAIAADPSTLVAAPARHAC